MTFYGLVVALYAAVWAGIVLITITRGRLAVKLITGKNGHF